MIQNSHLSRFFFIVMVSLKNLVRPATWDDLQDLPTSIQPHECPVILSLLQVMVCFSNGKSTVWGFFFTMQVIIPSSVHIEYHPPKNMVSYWVYSFRVYRGISYGDWSLGKLIPQPYFSGLWNHGTPNCHLVCIPPFQTKPRSQVCVKYIIYVVVEYHLWYLCCCLVIYIICPMIFLQNSCFLRERSLIITH